MYPSIISTFNIVSPTDRLNSPSHSALHNTVSSALGQVQAVIGLSTSSAIGTLMYDVRSPDSGGGGHVQTANKGGTGQTTYTKGDLLVANSNSVLTKLAIGIDGQTLFANSSTASGVQWSNGVGNATSLIPSNSFGNAATLAQNYSNSILGSFGLVTIPLNITANSISIECITLGDAGNAAKIAIYDESGQTRVASVFACILGTGIVTRPISSVFFAAGNYWTCVVPVAATNTNQYTTWKSDTSPGPLGSSVAGKKKFGGVVSVTGGTLPTTFNSASLVTLASQGVIVRLDT